MVGRGPLCLQKQKQNIEKKKTLELKAKSSRGKTVCDFWLSVVCAGDAFLMHPLSRDLCIVQVERKVWILVML